MKKTAVMCGFLFVLVLCAFGCATENAGEKKLGIKPFPATIRDAGFKLAENYAEGVFNALRKNDFTPWLQVIPPESRRRITEKMFIGMRESLIRQFGILEKTEYFGELDQTMARDYLWKMSFVAPAKNTPELRRIRQIIYWVRIVYADGKPVVGGFGLKPF